MASQIARFDTHRLLFVGYLKSKVYVTTPVNLEELQARIRQDIHQILPEVIDRVQQEFINRLGYCQVANGAQFEHLL